MIDEAPQESQLGEDSIVSKRLTIDGLLEEIKRWKAKATSGNDESSTERIIKALSKAEEEIGNVAQEGGLKKKASKKERK
jgi:hypothetical protein